MKKEIQAYIKKTFGLTIFLLAFIIYSFCEWLLFDQKQGLVGVVLGLISLIATYIYRVNEWKRETKIIKEIIK